MSKWTINFPTVPLIKVKGWDKLLLKGLVYKLFEGEHCYVKNIYLYIGGYRYKYRYGYIDISSHLLNCLWLYMTQVAWQNVISHYNEGVQEIWRKSRSIKYNMKTLKLRNDVK